MANLSTYGSYVIGMTEPLHEVIAVYIIVLVTAAVTMNAIVLYIFLKEKTLRDGQSYLLMNLSIADLLVASTVYPMCIVASFANKWVFGRPGCDYNAFGGFFYNANNMVTVAMITIERYYSVCKPVEAIKLWSGERTLKYIAVSWVYVAIVCIMPFIGWGEFAPEPYGRSCTINWFEGTVSNQTYTLFCFLTIFFIPLGTMIIYSSKLMRELFSHRWIVRPRGETMADRMDNNYRKKVMTPTLTAMGLLVIHLVCWTPYSVVSFIGQFSGQEINKDNIDLYAIAPNFAKLASLLNPLVLVLGYSKFRDEVKKLLLGKC